MSSRIPENFEIPEGIGFPEEVEILENFENSATVSRITLPCCISSYKICKYTVQFLLPVIGNTDSKNIYVSKAV